MNNHDYHIYGNFHQYVVTNIVLLIDFIQFFSVELTINKIDLNTVFYHLNPCVLFQFLHPFIYYFLLNVVLYESLFLFEVFYLNIFLTSLKIAISRHMKAYQTLKIFHRVYISL